jgi:hypothetical protein
MDSISSSSMPATETHGTSVSGAHPEIGHPSHRMQPLDEVDVDAKIPTARTE